MLERVRYIAAEQSFARHLGVEVVAIAVDRVVLGLPYRAFLGSERINGGAISALVDLAGTCACWSHPVVSASARGATVGFNIHFLKLVVASDLTATAQVRRRGRMLCVAEVVVSNAAGEEVALATLTYKLEP